MYTNGDLTKDQWAETIAYFDGRCGYCGVKPESMEQDHIVPLSKGGQHTASNVVPACRPCNRRKRYKSLLFFLGGMREPRVKPVWQAN